MRRIVIALALSAAIVGLVAAAAFAAGPPADPGLAHARETSGKVVPVQASHVSDPDEPVAEPDEEAAQPDEETEPADEPDEDEAVESASNAHCATDPQTATAEQLAELNHGAIVCWAAHQETPGGYLNHGAWVSFWARQNHGHEDPEDATGQPTDTTAASGLRGHGKPDHAGGRGHKPK